MTRLLFIVAVALLALVIGMVAMRTAWAQSPGMKTPYSLKDAVNICEGHGHWVVGTPKPNDEWQSRVQWLWEPGFDWCADAREWYAYELNRSLEKDKAVIDSLQKAWGAFPEKLKPQHAK